jgi:hypothetical protein
MADFESCVKAHEKAEENTLIQIAGQENLLLT